MSESSKNGTSPLMLATPTFDMGDALLSPFSRRPYYGCENDIDNTNQFISEFDSRTNTYRRVTNNVTGKNLTGNTIGTTITLNEFQCDICFKILTRKEHLKNHKLLHEPPKIFKCEICEREFNRRDHLKRHEDTHKPKVPKVWNFQLTNSNVGEEVKPEDGEEVKPEDEEEREEKEDEKEEEEEDGKVEKIEEEVEKLEEIESDHSMDSFNETSDQKRHQCPTCLKDFKRKSHLTRHMLTHSRKQYVGPVEVKLDADKLHECEFCKKRFGRKDHLKRHELTHTDLRLFKCEYCSKSFHQRTGLTRHELTHFQAS